MLEPWDEVVTLQKERLLCAEDVQTIKDSCAKEHGKKHVVECTECWARLLNRMRDRYLNSATKEWFAGRRTFLQDLDAMFSQARAHELDFNAIEERIIDEKKEWYRDKIRTLGLHLATKSPAEAIALQRKLNDRTLTADQLALELRETFSDGTIQSKEAFNDFIDRLKSAQSPKARNDAYIDIFFQPGHDPEGAARAQKYINMVANGAPIADAINAMLNDRQSAKGNRDQKQQLQKQLEELRRAKAAHELSKAKKDKAQQDKAKVAASSSVQYKLPPCSVCEKDVDPQNFLSCPLCQILAEHYGLRNEPTIFCSQGCQDESYEAHLSETHECAAGNECTLVADEDVEMETGDQLMLALCRECVETLETPSTFCSSRCFGLNFQRHREEVHLPGRQKAGFEVKDEGQIEFDAEDKTKYGARKIEDHIVTLHEAMIQWQQITSATVT
ncbi:hypothetical protein F4809DRAFT_601786 [Biscogniauxia mediterranea]|nr:hypothetical protein F4809DRAFT_601786 [Biscogniauxia mediterranea]